MVSTGSDSRAKYALGSGRQASSSAIPSTTSRAAIDSTLASPSGPVLAWAMGVSWRMGRMYFASVIRRSRTLRSKR